MFVKSQRVEENDNIEEAEEAEKFQRNGKLS